MRRTGTVMLAVCLGLAACAGREPNPVAVVSPTDSMMDCYAIQSEIAANNVRVEQLAREQGWKVAQNVAAGVAGLVIWPLWFGMDFQGTARKEAQALQQRQQYLAGLAARKRCANPIRPS